MPHTAASSTHSHSCPPTPLTESANGVIRGLTLASAPWATTTGSLLATIQHIAGDNSAASLGAAVDGPSASARFSAPAYCAFDANGVLYVTDAATVRAIKADGPGSFQVSTYAGPAGSSPVIVTAFAPPLRAIAVAPEAFRTSPESILIFLTSDDRVSMLADPSYIAPTPPPTPLRGDVIASSIVAALLGACCACFVCGVIACPRKEPRAEAQAEEEEDVTAKPGGEDA